MGDTCEQEASVFMRRGNYTLEVSQYLGVMYDKKDGGCDLLVRGHWYHKGARLHRNHIFLVCYWNQYKERSMQFYSWREWTILREFLEKSPMLLEPKGER